MTKVQKSLVDKIKTDGSVTLRLYPDGTGKREFQAAQGLRAQGIVNFRGVRTPKNADFIARSVYLS